MLQFVVAITIFVNAGSWVVAHPDHSHGDRSPASGDSERVWTTKCDRLRIVGVFVAEKQGQVQIRRADDTLASIAVTDLIASDREWVERRLAEIRRVNGLIPSLPGRGTLSVLDDITPEAFDEKISACADPLITLLAQLDPDKAVNDKLGCPEIAKFFDKRTSVSFTRLNLRRNRN